MTTFDKFLAWSCEPHPLDLPKIKNHTTTTNIMVRNSRWFLFIFRQPRKKNMFLCLESVTHSVSVKPYTPFPFCHQPQVQPSRGFAKNITTCGSWSWGKELDSNLPWRLKRWRSRSKKHLGDGINLYTRAKVDGTGGSHVLVYVAAL